MMRLTFRFLNALDIGGKLIDRLNILVFLDAVEDNAAT